jgi:hypothetical protein
MIENSPHDQPHDVHAVERDVEMYDKEAAHAKYVIPEYSSMSEKSLQQYIKLECNRSKENNN